MRAQDWERQDWRERFEADLLKTGWRVVSIEPPSRERAEYVYVLTLEPGDGESAPAGEHPRK